MDPSHPEERGVLSELLTRPLFWVLLIAASFGIPLIKGLNKDLPPVPPGTDNRPAVFALPDEHGAIVRSEDLRGSLLVVTDLPLANQAERERGFDGIRALRKRLRGMGSAVKFVVLCHGGDAAALSALLDAKTARKPVNVFLLDEGHEEMDALRRVAGAASARFLLLDRHGRPRGAWGDSEADVDEMVWLVGVLGKIGRAHV